MHRLPDASNGFYGVPVLEAIGVVDVGAWRETMYPYIPLLHLRDLCNIVPGNSPIPLSLCDAFFSLASRLYAHAFCLALTLGLDCSSR